MKRKLKSCSALAAAAVLAQAVAAPAALAASSVTAQPNVSTTLAPYFNDPAGDPKLSTLQMAKLLQKKVKYVFVIFNENHSFDNEFGTFPGARGLYADENGPVSSANIPGFTQTYTDVNGNAVSVQPFRIGLAQNSTVVDSVDHSHTGLATKMDVGSDGAAKMDKFAYREYWGRTPATSTAAAAKATQYSRLVMSHVDCDTIPFFWKWASNFTVFDNIFATEDTPSTPNAVAVIAGQAGETQWVKHGSTGATVTVGSNTGTLAGVPLVNDPQPFWGSQFDTTTTNKQPMGAQSGTPTGNTEGYGNSNIASNLTFASVPLTLQGRNIKSVLAGNKNPSQDLADIQQDIPYIQSLNGAPVSWRWYQEGYGVEATDTNGTASHYGYVSHHNGAQYFGYIANTPAVAANLKSETDFFTDIANNKLPNGGVFYIRGGYLNQNGLKPPVTANAVLPAASVAMVQKVKQGDDDHPGYTDRQISEAMMASVINAIASNPTIWSQSAIVITYDESDGFYDHVPPRILSYGPDGLPLSRGVRVPLLLISPYSRTHAVSHVEGDHNAVIQTINTIFGLPPLASLPDEAQALAAGNSQAFNQFGPAGFQQKFLGPRDINSSITESLLSGFDPKRLLGISAPLPSSLASIPASTVTSLPHYAGAGCSAIGMTPTDQQQGITNVIPSGFNPLPGTVSASN
ncbi:alkaline phosphatase family protein [Telmatospirillum sp.]|uniref:phospholipase C n=1 Tax=Telmatospirillum sp. TaxID=2079197 RepID=UPI002851A078|nr:alkaline phosphatase family protein [Telmatospirillum sp.]MDR3440044.1 alkaline phosphatase family protein [Telmatospirillum sp.]